MKQEKLRVINYGSFTFLLDYGIINGLFRDGGKTVESVEKIINKGIPVDAPVSLLASDILNLCSKSEELKDSLDKGLANLIEFL